MGNKYTLPRLIVALVIIVIIFGGIGISYFILSGKSVKQLIPTIFSPKYGLNVSDIKLNQDILYLSQPITSIDGTVEIIKGNTLTLIHHYTLSTTVENVDTSQKAKDVMFQFSLTPQTKIFRPPTYVPYLFKQNQPNSDEILKAGDLQVGQFVTVTTDNDLRVASSKPFTATSTQVTRISNNIQGIIYEITGNTIGIKANLPPLPPTYVKKNTLQTQNYTVHVTPDTEISNRQYGTGTPQLRPLNQLTNGDVVTVYSDQDTAINTELTALLIVPIDKAPPPASVTSP